MTALVGEHRMVTVTGRGGCGKTTLGLAAAEQLLERFAGGAWWVPLATVADPALVLPTIAAVVRTDPGGPAPAGGGAGRTPGVRAHAAGAGQHGAPAGRRVRGADPPAARARASGTGDLAGPARPGSGERVRARPVAASRGRRPVRPGGRHRPTGADAGDGRPGCGRCDLCRAGLPTAGCGARGGPDVRTDRSTDPRPHVRRRGSAAPTRPRRCAWSGTGPWPRRWTGPCHCWIPACAALFARMGTFAAAASVGDLEAVSGDQAPQVLDALDGLVRFALVQRREDGDARRALRPAGGRAPARGAGAGPRPGRTAVAQGPRRARPRGPGTDPVAALLQRGRVRRRPPPGRGRGPGGRLGHPGRPGARLRHRRAVGLPPDGRRAGPPGPRARRARRGEPTRHRARPRARPAGRRQGSAGPRRREGECRPRGPPPAGDGGRRPGAGALPVVDPREGPRMARRLGRRRGRQRHRHRARAGRRTHGWGGALIDEAGALAQAGRPQEAFARLDEFAALQAQHPERPTMFGHNVPNLRGDAQHAAGDYPEAMRMYLLSMRAVHGRRRHPAGLLSTWAASPQRSSTTQTSPPASR